MFLPAKVSSFKVYNPNINLSKFEPLKPSRSGDIQNIKKYNVYSQNTPTSCVYFGIKSSGLSPIYQMLL